MKCATLRQFAEHRNEEGPSARMLHEFPRWILFVEVRNHAGLFGESCRGVPHFPVDIHHLDWTDAKRWAII